jgi:hypothetical protein
MKWSGEPELVQEQLQQRPPAFFSRYEDGAKSYFELLISVLSEVRIHSPKQYKLSHKKANHVSFVPT